MGNGVYKKEEEHIISEKSRKWLMENKTFAKYNDQEIKLLEDGLRGDKQAINKIKEDEKLRIAYEMLRKNKNKNGEYILNEKTIKALKEAYYLEEKPMVITAKPEKKEEIKFSENEVKPIYGNVKKIEFSEDKVEPIYGKYRGSKSKSDEESFLEFARKQTENVLEIANKASTEMGFDEYATKTLKELEQREKELEKKGTLSQKNRQTVDKYLNIIRDAMEIVKEGEDMSKLEEALEESSKKEGKKKEQ